MKLYLRSKCFLLINIRVFHVRNTFGIMFATNITVICPYSSRFNFICWHHHPCIWFGTTHPCTPPHYGLWVNLYFFTICMYKHCFLPLLLVFVMKYCVEMHFSLPHNPYCCSLHSLCVLALLAHLYMHQLLTHCLPTIICVMLMSVALFFYFILAVFLFFLLVY